MEQRDKLRREIEDKLGRDERIVWYQRANPWRFFGGNDFVLVPLSGAGFAMMLYFVLQSMGIQLLKERSVIVSDINASMTIFMYAFLAIITYVFIGRIIAKIIRLKKSAYCITNERIFIYTNAFMKPIHVYKRKYGDNFRSSSSYPSVKFGGGGMMTYESQLKAIGTTHTTISYYGGINMHFVPNMRFNDANLSTILFENVKNVSFAKAVFEEMRTRDSIVVYEGEMA